jgi:hypothetical protein
MEELRKAIEEMRKELTRRPRTETALRKAERLYKLASRRPR